MTETNISPARSDDTLQPPTITSLSELDGIVEVYDSDTMKPKYTTFYAVSSDDNVFFGQIHKAQADITLEECSAALQHVPDHRLYPEVPSDAHLTITPEHIDGMTHIKRPQLSIYDDVEDEDFIPKLVLDEALIIEQIAQSPHPNIVHYYGCRIHRGRITGIVLASYEFTLTEYLRRDFKIDDQEKFMAALESAVQHLHGLDLAHNDLNPNNIMIGEDGMPIVIDFGSCQPFGRPLMTMATEGWCEALFFTSEKEHDIFALGKIRTWLKNPDLDSL